jgi:hypothetical protein
MTVLILNLVTVAVFFSVLCIIPIVQLDQSNKCLLLRVRAIGAVVPAGLENC